MYKVLVVNVECGAVRAARVTDATSRQLRLSWNRPHHINGILTGYSLTYTGNHAALADTYNFIHQNMIEK